MPELKRNFMLCSLWAGNEARIVADFSENIPDFLTGILDFDAMRLRREMLSKQNRNVPYLSKIEMSPYLLTDELAV